MGAWARWSCSWQLVAAEARARRGSRSRLSIRRCSRPHSSGSRLLTCACSSQTLARFRLDTTWVAQASATGSRSADPSRGRICCAVEHARRQSDPESSRTDSSPADSHGANARRADLGRRPQGGLAGILTGDRSCSCSRPARSGRRVFVLRCHRTVTKGGDEAAVRRRVVAGWRLQADRGSTPNRSTVTSAHDRRVQGLRRLPQAFRPLFRQRACRVSAKTRQLSTSPVGRNDRRCDYAMLAVLSVTEPERPALLPEGAAVSPSGEQLGLLPT